MIGGNGGRVQIEVLNYERAKATRGTDAKWLVCKCGVTVREFFCDVSVSLMSDDFVRFLGDLDEAQRSLKGTAVFAPHEVRSYDGDQVQGHRTR